MTLTDIALLFKTFLILLFQKGRTRKEKEAHKDAKMS